MGYAYFAILEHHRPSKVRLVLPMWFRLPTSQFDRDNVQNRLNSQLQSPVAPSLSYRRQLTLSPTNSFLWHTSKTSLTRFYHFFQNLAADLADLPTAFKQGECLPSIDTPPTVKL